MIVANGLRGTTSHSLLDIPKKARDTMVDAETVSLDQQKQALRKEAKKRFDAASKKFEDGTMSKKDFEKKMDETQDWLEKRLKELKKKFE